MVGVRIAVIGGGVLGTTHAFELVRRGHEVVQLEREPEARGATVRNFGLIWVSGRSGPELATTLRARELWERLAGTVPGIGFRACGSLTLLRTDAEIAVAEQVCRRADASQRGFELLDPSQARRRNPALRGQFRAALWCPKDAAVESRVTLPAIRGSLQTSGRYRFLPGREVHRIDVGPSGACVHDRAGDRHAVDMAILCPGAATDGLARELAGPLPLRRVRLQMMQTDPLDEPLTTALADADSLRYYPAFAGSALERLRSGQPQLDIAAQHHMQLLCVQRAHGGLTIGDTHEYTEPFPFDLDEEPYEHLAAVVEALLGRPIPRIRRRWAGVYAQSTTPDEIVHRRAVDPALWLVVGPGGRGMTLAPALAEQTADLAGL